MGRHSQPGSAYLEDLLSHLSEQLCHFTQARMEMADLYEKLHSLGSQKSVNSEELVATLEAVLQKYSSKCVSEHIYSRTVLKSCFKALLFNCSQDPNIYLVVGRLKLYFQNPIKCLQNRALLCFWRNFRPYLSH